jgi:hypothetical protein
MANVIDYQRELRRTQGFHKIFVHVPIYNNAAATFF